MNFNGLNKGVLKGCIVLLLLSSGSSVAADKASSWIKVPGTYTSFTNRDGTTTPGDFWYADDRSVINIRSVLNLTIADSEGLRWHIATSCVPKHLRYRQMNFSVVGTDHQGEWSRIGTDARRNNAFKFICSRYEKVKHGESYQSRIINRERS